MIFCFNQFILVWTNVMSHWHLINIEWKSIDSQKKPTHQSKQFPSVSLYQRVNDIDRPSKLCHTYTQFMEFKIIATVNPHDLSRQSSSRAMMAQQSTQSSSLTKEKCDKKYQYTDRRIRIHTTYSILFVSLFAVVERRWISLEKGLPTNVWKEHNKLYKNNNCRIENGNEEWQTTSNEWKKKCFSVLTAGNFNKIYSYFFSLSRAIIDVVVDVVESSTLQGGRLRLYWRTINERGSHTTSTRHDAVCKRVPHWNGFRRWEALCKRGWRKTL